jgi:hypothetical protein
MLGFKPLLLGAVVGGGAMLFAHRYHVVHTVDGVVVVPRAHQASLKSAYADVRGWNAERWSQHPDLSESMVKDGREQLMAASVVESAVDSAQHALEALIPSSHSAAAPQRPEIVFERPIAPVEGGASMAGRSESLLGRLAREAQQQHDSSPLEERPLTRERPAASDTAAPVRPAATPRPPLRDDRAEVAPEDGGEASIHAAAMERVSTELGQIGAMADSVIDDLSKELSAAFPDEQEPSPPADDSAPPAMESEIALSDAAPSSKENWDRPLARQTLPAEEIRLPQSDSFEYLPLEIDAQRLSESIPKVVREELRSLHTTSPGFDPSIKPL